MKPLIVRGTLPVHHIKVAPQTTKSARYANGVSPDSMNFVGPGVPGGLSNHAPMHSSPAAGPHVHPDLMNKAAEAADAEQDIGDTPRGTLNR
jgi:hypothetical protein